MGSTRVPWTAALFLAIFSCLLLTSRTAVGQGITTGSMSGTIEDQQGAVVPQATVLAVQTGTNATFKTASSNDGSFSFHDLPIGDYTLTVESGNFRPLNVKDIHVVAGVTANVGVEQLAVGSSSSSVTVESTAPILET